MLGFLLTAVAVSLSGVLAPGPMTAATLAAGTRRRHAGATIALGHAVVEFPLMILIIAGVGAVFELPRVKLGIGLAGGVFLAIMGIQLLLAARAGVPEGQKARDPADGRHPLLIGVVLTAANPYFLVWWATVGLALATKAFAFGLLAFVLFGVVHWLCDLVWLEALSLASYKGTELLGGSLQRVVLAICGAALLVFGGMFLFDAGSELLARS